MTLGELIETRRAVLGGKRGPLKLREVSERARAAGYTLAEATISAFVNHPLDEAPKRRTMEALAVGLDVTFAEVVAAVAASIVGDGGAELVQVTGEPHVQAFVTLTEGRTAEERARMIDVIRSVAAALDQSGNGQSRNSGQLEQPVTKIRRST